MRRGTWVVAALTATVVAVGVPGCLAAGGDEWVPVARVEVRDPTTIELVLDSCVSQPRVDLAQSDDVVEVTVRSSGGSGCDQWLRVTLDAPLGERAVVDARQGDELRVVGRTRPAAITEALVLGGGRTLRLGVATCQAQAEVTQLVESADAVTVQVSVTGGSSERDCLDSVEVPLADPLGDRDLLDATTGEPVPDIGFMAGS